MAKLKQMREQCGLSVIQVAELMGLSRITVWSYESGKRNPSFEKLQKFAKIYGCTVNDFVEEKEEG